MPVTLRAQVSALATVTVDEAHAQEVHDAASELLNRLNEVETAARRDEKDDTDINLERVKCLDLMRRCRDKGAKRALLKVSEAARIHRDKKRFRGKAAAPGLQLTLSGPKLREPKRSAAAATAGAKEEDDAAAPSSAASPSMAPAGAGAGAVGDDAEEDVGESDASDASDAVAASSVTRPNKKQRKAPPSDAELTKITARRATAWNGALSGFGWIDRDTVVRTAAGLETREQHYLKYGRATCLGCNESKSFDDPSNAVKHEKRPSHVVIWSKHLVTERAKFNTHFNRGLSSSSVLTAEQLTARRERLLEARTLAAARIVGGGTNPTQMDALFGTESPVQSAVAALRTSAGMGLGHGGTIGRDLVKAEIQLKKTMSGLMLNGPFGEPISGALTIDGATFHHLHALGVAFESAYLELPLFLGLVFAEPDEDEDEGFSYDHARCTEDLIALMHSYGVGVNPKEPEAPLDREKVLAALRLMLTCVMGDNVSYNAAVARLLGVALGKCIPHALSLTVKKSLLTLPLFKALVLDSSTLIYSGGSAKRAKALRVLGLNPNELKVYPNRFAGVINPAAYRLKNWDVCKTFHTTSTLLPSTMAVASSDSPEDDERNLHGHYAQKSKEAHESPAAPVVLAACGVMFKSVPDLIKALSADGDHTPTDAAAQLLEYREHLLTCKTDAASVVNQAAHIALGEVVPAAMMKTFKCQLAPVIESMMTESLASFDKHIGPMLDYLKMRQIYNPNMLAEVPAAADAVKKEDVGATSASFGPELKRQFIAYKQEVARLYNADKLKVPIPSTEEWNKMRPEERDKVIDGRFGYIHPAAWWRSKVAKWPALTKIALWHLSFPTSSIYIERVFARMRMMAVPQRLSASRETFARELLFRANLELVDKMLEVSVSRI